MNKKKFTKIEKMLKSSESSSGGPLEVTDSKCSPMINFHNIVQGDIKKDFLIHVEYYPERDKYGFALYEEGDGKN